MSQLNPRVHRRTFLKGMGLGLGSVAVAGPVRAASILGEGQKLQLARVWAPTLAQQRLLGAFDDTHRVFDDGSIELLLWPGDLQRLRATGLRHRVTVEDVVAHDAALRAATPPRSASLGPQPGERTDYRRLPDFEADMRSLVQRFPDKATLLTLPEKTLEGRTVYGIELGTDVSSRDGRPVFYMDGMHHAREWPAAEMPIMLAFDLLENYGVDPRVTAVMDSARVVIVPLMNPDGFHHSREALVQSSSIGFEGYWRKNRHSATGLTIPVIQKNPDAYGIDNNRNYPHNWGGPGSSGDLSTQTYRGATALSEPETQNVGHLLRKYHFTASQSSHTNGNLVLRPWGYSFDDPPDDELLKALGDECGRLTKYKSQKSIQLYITTGTFVDYAYGSFASLAFTFEHSGNGFHPTYNPYVPTMYALCRPAFLLLAEAAAKREWHGVITGRVVGGSGLPVRSPMIRLRKEFTTPLWQPNPSGATSYPEVIDTFMVGEPDGTFEYHVNPSTRPHLLFEGQTEPYQLIASGAGGTRQLEVTVGRGETVDLGDVQLA